MLRRHGVPLACAVAFAALWTWAAIDPLSRSDWALEQILVALTVLVVAATYRHRPVSDASYVLLTVFVGLHVVGSHWSYSNVPGFELGGGSHANVYDRVVHFLFGLLLALPCRELLDRAVPGMSRRVAWTATVIVVFAAASLYEVIEWVVVLVVAPDLGNEFLGAQGDPFDAVKDQALGLAGALAAAAVAAVAGIARRRATPTRPVTPVRRAR
jgi:putative membrane protein